MANRRAPRKTVDITTAPGPNTTDTAQHTRCHWPTIRYLPCQRPGSQSPTCPDTVPDTGPDICPGGSPSARAAPHPSPSPKPTPSPSPKPNVSAFLFPQSGPLLAARLPQGRLQCVSFYWSEEKRIPLSGITTPGKTRIPPVSSQRAPIWAPSPITQLEI